MTPDITQINLLMIFFMHASVIPKYLTSDTVFKGGISYLCDFDFHSVDDTYMSSFLQIHCMNLLKLEIYINISHYLKTYFPYHFVRHLLTSVHDFILKPHSKECFVYSNFKSSDTTTKRNAMISSKNNKMVWMFLLTCYHGLLNRNTDFTTTGQ